MEVCRAMELLAMRRIGALIVIERKQKLDTFVSAGMAFDGDVSAEILLAIFHTASPVHDGAVLVRNGRIRKGRALLPLSTQSALPMGVGTRHRSAVGITERTDAVVLVVSEERGEMRIAFRGVLQKVDSREALIKSLRNALRGRALVLKS